MRYLKSFILFEVCMVMSSAMALDIMVSVGQNDAETLKWLHEKEICEFIEVHPGFSPEQLRALRKQGWGVALQMMGHPESFDRRFINRPGKPALLPDKIYTQVEEVDRHIEGADGDAQKVIWQFIMEEDSAGVAFPYRMLIEDPQTHEEAYALFEKRLNEAYEAARSSKEKGVQLWGRAGYASSMHPFAKVGVEMNIIERTNDDIEDLSTGIAFARGSARQYGCKWGVDYSQWWGVITGLDMDFGGAYFRRNFYLSYFAGADLMGIEAIRPPNYDREANEPSSLGDALEEFSDFRKRVDAGTPDRPVAIMLPRDHGWITPAYWQTQNEAWNYARIPYRPGDHSIDGLFAAAYPGSTFVMQPFPFGAYEIDEPSSSPFALSSVERKYVAEDAHVYRAPPAVPFGRFRDRKEAKRITKEEKLDTSPYRPMADSRWGDIIDVLTDEVSSEVISQYEVLVIGGPLEVTDAMQTALEAYVTQGGTLVWAAGVARPEYEALTGVTIQPELRVGRAWNWQGDANANEPYLYFPSELIDENQSEVLAENSQNGAPLIVRNTFGKGVVVTCLSPWFASEKSPLADFALRALDTVIDAVQPITIEGLPVQWCSTQSKDTRTVTIANHSGETWEGTIHISNLDSNLNHCEEMRSQTPLKSKRSQQNTQVTIQIPAYDVAVVRWSKR